MSKNNHKKSSYFASSLTEETDVLTPIKGNSDDNDITIIEVPETPESLIQKRQTARKTIAAPVYDISLSPSPPPPSASLKSITTPPMDSKSKKSLFLNDDDEFDSPIIKPQNKSRAKRVIYDSDEETDDLKVVNGSKRFCPERDEIGDLAFEDKCESSIKELRSIFPEVDIVELQDALIECDWDVFAASIKLGNVNDNDIVDNIDKDDSKSNDGSDVNGVKTKKECVSIQNDDKMKNMDYYRKKECSEFYNKNGDNDKGFISLPSSSKMLSLKNRQFFSNKKSNKRYDDDDDDKGRTLISSGSEESGDDYDKDDILGDCFDSDDGGDARYKPNADNKVKHANNLRIGDLRKKVVQFLQEGNVNDLLSVSGVSQKKIDAIIEMRPYVDWDDLRFKFDNHRSLSCDLLNNCVGTIKAREVVERLMNMCQELSNDISLRVDKIEKLDQPEILNHDMELANYQLIGLNWLVLMFKKKLNCILADEMGLGKTIQVIALLAYLREKHKIRGHHLIIVPASTLDNWTREIQLWCPSMRILLYYGSQDERLMMREQISNGDVIFDVMVTTYNMVYGPDDKKLFKRKLFEYVVFDEAHMLKNMRSNRYAGLMKIKAKRRLLLTGTPLQNNLLELMSLLIFTMPDLFQGKTEHVKALFTYSNKDARERSAFDREKIEHAKMIMKPFVLRRLKVDVLKDLPTKFDHKVHCPMSPNQELKYMELIENYTRQIRYRSKNVFEDNEYDESYCTFKKGASMLMGLRKAANHPLLLRTYYDDTKLRMMSRLMLKEPTHRDADPKLIYEDMEVMHDFELHALCKQYKSLSSYVLDDDIIEDSGKFQELSSLLTNFKYSGNRILLFSQFTMMLDIIEEYMRIRRYRYLRLDGDTKVADRMELIDKFNNDSSIFVFLLSTKAGGLGINLTAANVVIIHDIDFNPYNDKQAEDRCHRVGQTKEVIVYRLISQNTVEEGMLKIAEEKLKLGHDVATASTNVSTDEVESTDVRNLLRAALGL